VWLPVREAVIESPLLAVTGRASGDPLDILLVEDDPIVAAVIGGLLEAQGHHVRHVVHALDALTELAAAPADAILLDLDLPGLNGFQLAGLIRRRPETANLPIFAVSARSVGDEDLLTREAGMDGFLRKPVTGDQLAALLAPLCELTCRAW
jgi:CheY-like chemotaxis protein